MLCLLWKIQHASTIMDNSNTVNAVNMDMAQKMTKHIPVSEETWKELGRMKEAGETYDELLNEMIQDHNRTVLLQKMEKIENMDEEELVPLDEL